MSGVTEAQYNAYYKVSTARREAIANGGKHPTTLTLHPHTAQELYRDLHENFIDDSDADGRKIHGLRVNEDSDCPMGELKVE